MSTVGATVAGPTPPAHPAAVRATRTIIVSESLFMAVLL
jgi:hypothetical protein